MNKNQSLGVVMAVMVIMTILWLSVAAALAALLSWVTTALHNSGLAWMPSLSFLQSAGVMLAITLLSIPLRVGKRRKEVYYL